MTKKRVHEIAKEQGISSKELLEKLKAAGVEAKAAASSVDETLALKALAGGGAASNGAPATTPAKGKGSTATVAPPAAVGEKQGDRDRERLARRWHGRRQGDPHRNRQRQGMGGSPARRNGVARGSASDGSAAGKASVDG